MGRTASSHEALTGEVRRVRREISWWQFTMMLASANLSLLATYAPVLTSALPPSRDSWLAALAAAIPSVLLMLAVYALTLRFPKTPVFEYTQILFGPFVGKLLNLYLIGFFLIWATVAVKQSAVFFATAVYLRTPVVVFIVGFLLLALVAIRDGIELIGRVSEFSGVLVIFGLLVFMVGSLPIADLGRVLPILGEGIEPVGKQALTSIGVFGQASWIALLGFPHIAPSREIPKAILTATAITVSLTALGAILLLGILGEDLISVLAFPSLTAARTISFANIFERVEWIIVIMWMGAMGIKVSLLTLGATMGLKHTFPSLHNGKTAVGAILAVFVVSQFWQTHLTDVLNFFGPGTYLRYALPFQLTPLLFLAAALLRGTEGKKPADGHRPSEA